MSEMDGTTEATTEQVATETTPSNCMDAEGNFTEGWKDKYVPENLRGEEIFNRTKSMQGAMSMLSNFDKMKGADTMTKPSDKYTDDDWDAYHKAGGWTGEDAKFERPEDMPEEVWSDERATKFAGLFNQLRLNPTQISGIMEAYNADVMQEVTDYNNNSETYTAQLKADLLSEWGNAYTQKEHLANFAIEKGTKGDADFKDRILQKFGNDPDFIKYNANIGGDFSGSGQAPNINQAPTPKDIDAQIQVINNSDAFSQPLHPEHKQTMATLARLYKEKAIVRVPA